LAKPKSVQVERDRSMLAVARARCQGTCGFAAGLKLRLSAILLSIAFGAATDAKQRPQAFKPIHL
jgi:hypothetical protein